MTSSELLKLSKEGNPQAIAALINRQLQPNGITAKASLKDGCLQIMLETAAQVPNQQAFVEFVRKGITKLGATSIQKVKVYGRQIGQKVPSWSQEFELVRQPLPSTNSQVTQLPTPNAPAQFSGQGIENSAEAFFNQGVEKSTDRNQEAIEDFTQAIHLNPDYAEAYFMRGSNYLTIKSYQGAIEDYNRAIELKPDYAQAYYGRGLVRSNLKDYQGAVEDYSQAILLNIKYYSLYYDRGLAYDGLGFCQKAINDVTQAIKLNPNEGLYYQKRGELYQKITAYREAIEDYSQAIQLNINNESIFNNRGSVYEQLGLYQEAIEDFNQAIYLNPEHRIYHKNLKNANNKLNKLNFRDSITQSANNKDSWYKANPAIIIMLVAVWPVGLYLMFKYSQWSNKVKGSVISVLAVTFLLSGFLSASDTSASSSMASKESSVVDREAEIPQEYQDSATSEQKFIADYQRLAAGIAEPAIRIYLLRNSQNSPENFVRNAKDICNKLAGGDSWNKIVAKELLAIDKTTDDPLLTQTMIQHSIIANRLATVHFCPQFPEFTH